MSVFLLPRLLGRKIVDPRGGRIALATMAAGISLSYLAYFSIGLLESIQIHNGFLPAEARANVLGDGLRYAVIVLVQGILGLGYVLLFRHVAKVIGRNLISAYFRNIAGRMSDAIRFSVRVHPRARAASPAQAQRRALTSAVMECIFPGLGWFFSGRPFIGTMMFSLGTIYLTIVYVVIAIAGNAGPFLTLGILYLAIILLSGAASYRTYLSSIKGEALQTT
jgi:hypothetical protein